MTWEETVEFIREKPGYSELVEKAYFDKNLCINIERFKTSEEFKETLFLLKRFSPSAKTILDIGSGNGISAISFSLEGYKVTALEPDTSDTVGSGAIKKLKHIYNLPDLNIYEKFAEDININDRFDVIYVRQAMHHAYDLNLFVKNLSRLLKPGGLLLTVRDHVVFNDNDKQWFLREHPLQKFYGGENAFTEKEYVSAFRNAGLTIQLMLRHFDSIINFFPLTNENFQKGIFDYEQRLKNQLKTKIGFFANFKPVLNWYKKRTGFSIANVWDEAKIPGRMYSFVAIKS